MQYKITMNMIIVVEVAKTKCLTYDIILNKTAFLMHTQNAKKICFLI